MIKRIVVSIAALLSPLLSLSVYSTHANASIIVADNLSAPGSGSGQIGFIAIPAGFFNSAMGQTFTASTGGILETITVRHSSAAPELNPLVMSFFAAAFETPSTTDLTGAALAQVTIPYASIPGNASYTTDFDFSSFNINLASGDTYGFLLSTATGRSLNFVGQYGVPFSGNTYAGGNNVRGTNGATGSTFGVSSADLLFRVTVASSSPPVSMPEPSSLMLLALGLGAFGFAARVRRR